MAASGNTGHSIRCANIGRLPSWMTQLTGRRSQRVTSMPKVANPNAFIFDMPTGIQAVKDHQVFMRENSHMALKFPIPELQYYFHPVFPGEQATIQAESHNFKSGWIDFWASYAARTLPGDKRSVIIKINTEDAVESLVLSELAKHGAGNLDELSEGRISDPERYITAEVEAGSLPIIHIGESLGMDDSNASQLYLSNIARLIDMVRKDYFAEQVEIAAIFVDYIQALPIDPEVKKSNIEQTRRLQVMQDENRVRRMAKYFKCPVVVAAQSREMDRGKSNKLYMPGFFDIQETTFVSQHTDRLAAIALPKMNGRIGELIEYGGVTFTVAENQLWIKCEKQKRYKNVGASFPLLIGDDGNVSLDAAIWALITRMERRQ